MVAVIGGNNHPYDEAKTRFEEAVLAAARYHWKMQCSCKDGNKLDTSQPWKQQVLKSFFIAYTLTKNYLLH